MDGSTTNTASTAKRDLFTSPTRVMDSSKKRTLRINFKRHGTKNGTHESSGSPIRKVPQPLLSSTPKPSPKKPNMIDPTPSVAQQDLDRLLLERRAVVVLDRTVVEEYFAKKNKASTQVPPSKPANGLSHELSKKQGTKKQAAEKKTNKTHKNARGPKFRAKKLAAISSPVQSVETPTATLREGEEMIDIETEDTENHTLQQMQTSGNAVTRIPSEVLETFGISSHQEGNTSVCSTITQPLSPGRPDERTPSPDQNENTPTPTSSTYYSPNGAQETPSLNANEVVESEEVAPYSLSILAPQHISSSTPVPETSRASISVANLPKPADESEDDMLAVVSDSDLLCELEHRLFESPKILRLNELKAGSKDARRIAPYCLKIADNDERFFMYAAVLGNVTGKYCCLVFGTVEGRLVAYGGHFIVSKGRIYDPVLKTPVKDVTMTKLADCRRHFSLFNIRNAKLLEYGGYFEQIHDGPYRRLQEKFVDSFLNSVDQISLKEKARWENAAREKQSESRSLILTQGKAFPVTTTLKEPRIEQVFYETCLPVTQERMNSILKFVCSMGNVKKRFGELAVMLTNCALQLTFDTAYYAAHEDDGCTAFYPTSYLLGRTDDHYVVGVVAGQSFFIMATKRLFSRFDELAVGLQPVVPSDELFESINLPLWLSHEYSLIMLEVRQILMQPSKYQEQFKELNQAIGIAGFRSTSLEGSFLDMASATQSNSRSLHNAWLEQILDGFYNVTFRNSPCKFPTHPACLENPQKFCENMLKLWMQRLLRGIHGIEEPDILISYGATSLSELEFFTIDPASFAEHFLPVFGLSEEHTFSCLGLDSRGEPSHVCQETLSATAVAKHIEDCHVRPLLWDDSNPTREFTPFALVFHSRDNPPLSETCDFDLLSWALSLAAKWPTEPESSYVKFIQSLSKAQKSKSSFSEKTVTTPAEKQNKKEKNKQEQEKQNRKSSPGYPLAAKRKRSIEEVLSEELKRRCINLDID